MEAVISILVYAVIFFAVISRVKKKKASFNGSSNTNTVTMTKPVSRGSNYGQESVYSSSKKNKTAGVNAHMAREKINIRGWEDRRGDWLARQMEDERQAQRRVSEMFQLKMQHKYNCDAEMLKQFHESHCDANSVDTAQA